MYDEFENMQSRESMSQWHRVSSKDQWWDLEDESKRSSNDSKQKRQAHTERRQARRSKGTN